MGIDFTLQIVYNNFNNHKTMFCGAKRAESITEKKL